MMKGMIDVGGGCCIGDCCVMDNPVGDFFKDMFGGSSGGCGYHPGPSENEVHAKKIADELAQMKENIRISSQKQEGKILDDIQRSMNSLIVELGNINGKTYGGKELNLNLDAIIQKNNSLKNEVIGHIGNVMDDKLVLTDKELSVILEERNDDIRAKNFESFCQKIQKQSLKSLSIKIEDTVNKQSELVKKEIQARIKEVEKSMKESLDSYTEIIELKESGGKELEQAKARYIFKAGLCDLLFDEIDN